MRIATLAAGLAIALALSISSPAFATGLGVIFDEDTFHNTDADGVDDDFRSFQDFSAGEFNKWTSNGHQYLRILPEANNNGDAGMHSHDYGVAPQEIYTGKAWVKTTNFQTPFRARLTVHWKDGNGNHINSAECNSTGIWGDEQFHTVEIGGCRAPLDARTINLAIRANNGGCSSCPVGFGYGTVVVDRFRFARTA